MLQVKQIKCSLKWKCRDDFLSIVFHAQINNINNVLWILLLDKKNALKKKAFQME